MGVCQSAPAVPIPTEEEIKKSLKIADGLALEAIRQKEVTKLLLLGPGESGKSTIFKQMVRLYGKGFSIEDRKAYIPLIHVHVLNSIKTLCRQIEGLSGKISTPLALLDQNEEARAIVEALNSEKPIDKEAAGLIAALWADPCIKEIYEHRSKYYITDSAGYFLDQVTELAKEDYIPSEQDVFRCRIRSTAIVEEEFQIDTAKFKMLDVGGQRSERKKWIHCFQDVTCIAFVCAISEYDMVLFEDSEVNRMDETLRVFEDVVNNQYMKDIPILLFLNKKDLFAEKIEKKVPLTIAFPEYKEAETTVSSAAAYIRKQFEMRNRNPKRPMYTHMTCATDTENVRFVFSAVKEILVAGALKEGGLSTP